MGVGEGWIEGVGTAFKRGLEPSVGEGRLGFEREILKLLQLMLELGVETPVVLRCAGNMGLELPYM